MLLSLAFAGNAANKEVSLITAWPGGEIYELCGHEAVRIKGDGIDSVWNFGIFNFNEPNFVYRFVKGETDYMVMGYPFSMFVPEYQARGSRIEEQVLNLTPQEVDSLHALLRKHALPPLNRYRYNYIKNNCSTQIAELLDEAVDGKIDYQNPVMHATYRDAMRDYHKNYPWYQFGIDIALGLGLEEKLDQNKELFIPVEFNRHASNAFLPDGRPLVKSTNVIYEGRENAVEGPTPFLLTPLWFSILIAAISLALVYWGWKKKFIPKFWYAVFFGLEGLAGCLVAFLVFISEHEATSPNLLIFWLNPLQLLIPVCIWWKQLDPVSKALMWLNIAAAGVLLVLTPIFNRGQGSQAALIILMATDLILAGYYLKADEPGKGSRKGNKTGKKNILANLSVKKTRKTKRKK